MHKLKAPNQGQIPQRSSQLLQLLHSPRSRSVRVAHLQDLSLGTVHRLLATMMQCMTLGSLCVATSLQRWVWAKHEAKHEVHFTAPNPVLIYRFGMPYKMEMNFSGNLTDTGQLYFFGESRDVVTLALVVLCCLSFCFSVTALLLNFKHLRMLGQYQMALESGLHILSAIFTMGLLAICGWCFVQIKKVVRLDPWKQCDIHPQFGESFYIGLLASGFAIWAIALSLWSMKLSKGKDEPRVASIPQQ